SRRCVQAWSSNSPPRCAASRRAKPAASTSNSWPRAPSPCSRPHSHGSPAWRGRLICPPREPSPSLENRHPAHEAFRARSHQRCSAYTVLCSHGESLGDAVVTMPLPGHPFQALTSADGRWIYVSILGPDLNVSPDGITVLRRERDRVSLVRVVP